MPTLVDQFGSPLSSVSLTDEIYVDNGVTDGRASLQKVYNLFDLNFFSIDVGEFIKNPLTGLYFATEFLENHVTQGTSFQNGTGSGTSKYTTNEGASPEYYHGAVRSATGSTATGRAQYRFGTTNGKKLGEQLLIGRYAVDSLSQAGELFNTELLAWITGYGYASGLSEGVCFKYDAQADGHFWSCLSANGTLTEKTVTVVPVVAGEFYWFAIKLNAAWTEAKFYISTNGVTWTLVATHTNYFPLVGNNILSIQQISKGVGVTPVGIICDHFMTAYKFTR